MVREFCPHYLQSKHPYGCRTQGDALLVPSQRVDDCFLAIDDDALLDMLSFLDAHSLARLSSVSRRFYVFCHHSELWRDLALMLCQARCLPVEFHGNWRDTVVLLLTGSQHPHSPMQVQDVFSNALSRSWACIAYDLDLSLPKFYALNNIPVISATDTSFASFIEHYEARNAPVVISDAISGWGALSKWSDEYLSQVCGEKLFRATSAMAAHSASFTMEQYLKYSKQCKDEVPLYLFERDFASHERLSDDFSVPSYFNSDLHPGTDLFRVFGKSRPDHRWLIVGPKNSGSIFHIDPNMTHAWNAAIRGRKKWIFYTPHAAPPVSELEHDIMPR